MTEDLTQAEITAKVALLLNDLLANGYVEVDQAYDVVDGLGSETTKTDYNLRPGTRVAHVSQRYQKARDKGTATVLHVLVKGDSAWTQKYGEPDVEVIVQRDREVMGNVIAQWAHYHCVNANHQPEASDG